MSLVHSFEYYFRRIFKFSPIETPQDTHRIEPANSLVLPIGSNTLILDYVVIIYVLFFPNFDFAKILFYGRPILCLPCWI